MPCQVYYRDRYIDLSHGCLAYVIESAAAFCRDTPQSEFIRGCVAHWSARAASSGHNLLDLDLDRLAIDPQRAAELQHFLADLREWMGTHGRADYPDGRPEPGVD